MPDGTRDSGANRLFQGYRFLDKPLAPLLVPFDQIFFLCLGRLFLTSRPHYCKKFGTPLAFPSSSTYYFKLESARDRFRHCIQIHSQQSGNGTNLQVSEQRNTYILSDASRLFLVPCLRLVSRRFLRTSSSFFGQPDKTCMLVCVIQRWTSSVWRYGTMEPTDMPCFEFPPKPPSASTTDTDALWVDMNLWSLSKKNTVKSLKYFRCDESYIP